MLVDKGSVFMLEEWRYAAEINGIELVTTGVESHSSLGAGKTYHAYLRRVFTKLLKDFPSIDESTLLCMAVKALSDCTGPRGLVPS